MLSDDQSVFKMAANNPRKFEEKIAQHKLRQAQETKEFEKIIEEISFVSVSVVFLRIIAAKKSKPPVNFCCYLLIGEGT